MLSCFERDRFVWPLAAAGTVVIIPAQLGSTSADCDPLGDSRLMALASIYDAGWQEYASEIGGVTVQIVRDLVMRVNERGPDCLINRKAPGSRTKLNDAKAARSLPRTASWLAQKRPREVDGNSEFLEKPRRAPYRPCFAAASARREAVDLPRSFRFYRRRRRTD